MPEDAVIERERVVREFGLPVGWMAPRKEFFLAGFGNRNHHFAFDAAELKFSDPRGFGVEHRSGAKCLRCGAVMHPDMAYEHARLHLVVDLAKEEMSGNG